MKCKIKLCGINNHEDLLLVAKEGADYAGVLVEIDSIRAVSLEDAIPLFKKPPLSMVAVTMDRTREDNLRIVDTLAPTALQLHGDESPEHVASLRERAECEIWKALHLPAIESGASSDCNALLENARTYAEAGVDRIVIDAVTRIEGETLKGGTGKSVDWNAARRLRDAISIPLILAGGLKPDNVAQAINLVDPFALDCSSGVEIQKGRKDPERVRLFIQRARVADNQKR